MQDIGSTISDSARQWFESLVQHLPAILGALALVILGWLAAHLARLLTSRGMQVFETLLQRATGRAPNAGLQRSTAAFSSLTFWVVLLSFIAVATQTLGLGSFTQWLARLLEYLPTLAAGILIIAAGFILARFIGDLVYATTERLADAQRATLARLARGATLFAALLVGADQIGLRVTWIAVIAVIIIGSVMGGVVLAASLGARDFVANLIGAHYLRQTLQIGERVRIGAHEGRVVDVTATSVVLENAAGRVALPGSVFHRRAVEVIASPENV